MTLPALRDLINQHFSDEELSQLCLDLSIKYDNLPGDTHIAKAQALVEHCLRHNCLPQLGRRCRELRPRTMWPDTDKLAAEWQAAQEKQTRLHAVFTGDELAEMLEPWQEKETAILTQLVGGDQITVGDMTNSIAAVGRNAQVHITGNIYYGKPADNPQEARRSYREVLAAGSRALPLRGVDVGVSDPAAGQNALELAHVYIDLDTKTSVGADDLAELKIGKVRLWAEGKGLPVDSVTVSREKEAAQKEKPLPALTAAIIQRQLILLGDPGGGKTTFVRHLAHCLAAHALHPDAGWLANLPGWPRAEADILPVMVILRDFARSLPSPLPEKAEVNHLWQFIETRLKAQNLEFAADAIHDKLEAGEALLLLDGLDEVPSKEQRVFVRDAAAAFAARYPDCRALVTCRVLSYQPPAAPDEIDLRLPANKFPVFELAPFDDEKIDRFIAAWYQELARADVVAQEDAAGLTRKLQKAVRRPDLWRLAPNPLLLTVMALVHTHKGRLPDARALLYEETIDILLWRWEQIKAGGKEDAPQLRQLLLDAGRSEMDLKKLLWRLAYEAHSQVAGDADGEKLADIGELKLTKALAALKADDWN
ncbi:MAG TPA: NACHT domain-containing protein, partial [Anaerolineae bacterium]|nr:NACHT domain-containing protein [Anaerolineae bacterium]